MRAKERKSSDEEWTDIVEKREAVNSKNVQLTMSEVVQVAVFKQKLQTSIKLRKNERKSSSYPQSRSSRPNSGTVRSSLKVRRAGRKSGSSVKGTNFIC